MARQQPSCNRLSEKFPRGTLFTNYILGWSPQVAAQRTMPKKNYIAGNILFRSIRIAAYPQAELLSGSSEAGIPEIAALLRA